MQKLISELLRLYLPEATLSLDALADRVTGRSAPAIDLCANGATRALVIPFRSRPGADPAAHWDALCGLANAMQTELGLPAPAVSVGGSDGYGLWLSFQESHSVARMTAFLDALRRAYSTAVSVDAVVGMPVELPPCLDPHSGKWAAFIHPGMGASFAAEAGLEMAPPLAGQTGFLETLHCITASQFEQALQRLPPAPDQALAVAAPTVCTAPAALLLKDATLEDIVRFLHAKNIEPTFRHRLPS